MAGTTSPHFSCVPTKAKPLHWFSRKLRSAVYFFFCLPFCNSPLTGGGWGTPPAHVEWPQLQYVLRCVKRTEHTNFSIQTWLPITVEVMMVIHSVLFSTLSPWDAESSAMIWAACCVGYFGFMRSGEFTASRMNRGSLLSFQDLAIDSHSNPSVIRIHLQRAKTDPFGKGVFVYLGKGRGVLCHISALLHILPIIMHPSSGIAGWIHPPSPSNS